MVKEGQHFWAIFQGKLLIVIYRDGEYWPCGAWEGTIDNPYLVQRIDEPKGYEKRELYF